MKVGSDTFDNPYFQMVLQNQQFSPIIGAFGCFAKHFGLVKKCQILTFKVNFLCLIFFFNWNYWFNSTFFVTLAA